MRFLENSEGSPLLDLEFRDPKNSAKVHIAVQKNQKLDQSRIFDFGNREKVKDFLQIAFAQECEKCVSKY